MKKPGPSVTTAVYPSVDQRGSTEATHGGDGVGAGVAIGDSVVGARVLGGGVGETTGAEVWRQVGSRRHDVNPPAVAFCTLHPGSNRRHRESAKKLLLLMMSVPPRLPSHCVRLKQPWN